MSNAADMAHFPAGGKPVAAATNLTGSAASRATIAGKMPDRRWTRNGSRNRAGAGAGERLTGEGRKKAPSDKGMADSERKSRR
jgi:hypothetical protein